MNKCHSCNYILFYGTVALKIGRWSRWAWSNKETFQQSSALQLVTEKKLQKLRTLERYAGSEDGGSFGKINTEVERSQLQAKKGDLIPFLSSKEYDSATNWRSLGVESSLVPPEKEYSLTSWFLVLWDPEQRTQSSLPRILTYTTVR